jgi:hypothetical protein
MPENAALHRGFRFPELKIQIGFAAIRDEAAGCGAARRLLKISSAWS